MKALERSKKYYNPYNVQLDFTENESGSLATMGENNLRVVSLFSGCGGMDIGLEGGFKVHESLRHPHFSIDANGCLKKTRFSTVFANDIRPGAKLAWQRYYRNRPEGQFKLCSIVDFVKAASNGGMQFPECEILTGGFPCQDFSVAGKRKGFKSDKSDLGVKEEAKPTEENRGMLYMWMRRAIELARPKMFIAENVKGLISLGEAKEIIAKDFSSVGDGYYVFPPQVLRAVDYGIPQTRERVFFIGISKAEVAPELLRKIEKDPFNTGWNPYPSPLKDWSPKLGNLLSDLPEPESAKDLSQTVYSKAKWYGKHCQGQTEVDLEGAAPTIRSEHHGNIEFRRLSLENGGRYKGELKGGCKQRRLSVRECARIQTFPDDYDFIFKGKEGMLSGSEAYKLIGNAVPPLLAYQLALKIEKIWDSLFK